MVRGGGPKGPNTDLNTEGYSEASGSGDERPQPAAHPRGSWAKVVSGKTPALPVSRTRAPRGTPAGTAEPMGEPSPVGGEADSVSGLGSPLASLLPPWRRDSAKWDKAFHAASPVNPRKPAPWRQAFLDELARQTWSVPMPQANLLMKFPKATEMHPGDTNAAVTEPVKTVATEPSPSEKGSVSEPEAELEANSGKTSSSSKGPEAEQEPEAAHDSPRAVSNFDVQEMLRWRAAVGPEAPEGFTYSTQVILPALPRSSTPKMDRDRSDTEASGAEASTCRSRLRSSETSWAVRQRSCTGDDAKVTRAIKSILNKLTLERFPQLYQQLTSCGITALSHVEYLIKEVFEKATTQHHFIDMYADLCTLLHEHFTLHPVVNDAKTPSNTKFSFKRLLLNECQASFERYLTPPSEIGSMTDFEERTLAETRYKTRMLGNIRLVGALLTRKMLAAKIMFAVMDELTQDPTPEALESLAALLTVVGPVFDTPDWQGRPVLIGIFHRVRELVKLGCEPRARCLLQDVLDLRASGWEDRKPKRTESPMMLSEVAEVAAIDDGTPRSRGSITPSHQLRVQRLSQMQQRQASDASEQGEERAFDREAFREELHNVFCELRCSHDEAGAAMRLADLRRPRAREQIAELHHLLGEAAQERDAWVRSACFRLAVGLFGGRGCEMEVLAKGLQTFATEVCEDLRVDVPALPRVVREELVPVIAPLVAHGQLPGSLLKVMRAL